MELVNEIDDLNDKNIEINSPSDISSTSNQEPEKNQMQFKILFQDLKIF